ncbi:hypothetical protein SBA7_1580012 [Candidatus Sulfotelmatobacter sp. SbA7]|nr:hypothetical protein SBA7_1580012 [Candidatus Sulfotelmatobacter sp. SbA7]
MPEARGSQLAACWLGNTELTHWARSSRLAARSLLARQHRINPLAVNCLSRIGGATIRYTERLRR